EVAPAMISVFVSLVCDQVVRVVTTPVNAPMMSPRKIAAANGASNMRKVLLLPQDRCDYELPDDCGTRAVSCLEADLTHGDKRKPLFPAASSMGGTGLEPQRPQIGGLRCSPRQARSRLPEVVDDLPALGGPREVEILRVHRRADRDAGEFTEDVRELDLDA